MPKPIDEKRMSVEQQLAAGIAALGLTLPDGAEAKLLARTLGELSRAEGTSRAVASIAERRASDEGREGTRAFLEKRLPSWAGAAE